jgi:hypothetical protein
MTSIAKLTFGGGIPGILLGPMILCLDGGDAWLSIDHYPLTLLVLSPIPPPQQSPPAGRRARPG